VRPLRGEIRLGRSRFTNRHTGCNRPSRRPGPQV